MSKIVGVTLEIDERTGKQHTEIVREHATGEQETIVLIEKPLSLVDDIRGHEMVLARS